VQNHLFIATAAILAAQLRYMGFKAILRQDIEFFDEDENSTGSLTLAPSDNPQKANDFAGGNLGVIVQSFFTLLVGLVLDLVFEWKIGLVGLACMSFLVSAGYVRLRVVMLKDRKDKRTHEKSAQLACEAAGAIRTIASLTRELGCTNLYSKKVWKSYSGTPIRAQCGVINSSRYRSPCCYLSLRSLFGTVPVLYPIKRFQQHTSLSA
jgi:ATP-binding cassette, subfamily B (MDR/TAP), member 1